VCALSQGPYSERAGAEDGVEVDEAITGCGADAVVVLVDEGGVVGVVAGIACADVRSVVRGRATCQTLAVPSEDAVSRRPE
jgi:hypothetical protein